MQLPSHKTVSSQNVRYSFHHLQPSKVILPGRAKNGQDLIVRLSFMSHVYSKNYNALSLEAKLQDEAGNPRSFCPIRYNLSLQVRVLCEQLLLANEITWHSKDRHQKSNLAICDSPNLAGLKYLIFYTVFPSKSKNAHLEFLVKSAYEKQLKPSSISNPTRIVQILRTCHINNRRLP